MANSLFRFDEGSPDIVISYHPELQRYLGLGGIPQGRWESGIRDRNDHVHGYGCFFGELGTKCFSDLIDVSVKDETIWPSKIDEFKDALMAWFMRERFERFDFVSVDQENFSWF